MDVEDFDAANSWFDYINQRNDNFSEACINRLKARFYLVKGEHEDAMVYLDKAEFGQNDMGISLYFAAEKAFYKGDYTRAIDLYLELQQKDKGEEGFYMLENGNAALHMVYVCLQSNATDNANATFEKFEQYTLGTRATQSNSPYFT